jgi:hypothetical protein
MSLHVRYICFAEKHEANEIFRVAQWCMQAKFNLEERVDAVTTDNGANFVLAVQQMVKEGTCEDSMRCACHSLQLCIKKALEVRFRMPVVSFYMCFPVTLIFLSNA